MTKYVRDGPPLPASIKVVQGASETLKVPNIYSYFKIGTTLRISLRQKVDEHHSFVHFVEQGDGTKVTIDAKDLIEGDEYQVILESFNSLSIAKSTLRTDIIKVSVVKSIPPSFAERP